MQKILIVNLGFKKIIAFYILCIAFLVILSVAITGFGNKGVINGDVRKGVDKYSLNKEDIVLKKDSKIPNIKVYLSQENKVVDMNLEEYVRGVVCAEMPADFGLEAIKAQAVAARTYALAHMEQYGGTNCSSANGADICDTVNSQAYMSKEKRLSLWNPNEATGYWNKITDAVNQTEGQVLSYNGKLVLEPLYFAVSSGKTEDSAEVFATGQPYLKSVASVGEEKAQNFKTTKRIGISEFINSINSKYPKAKLTSNNIKNQISILDRTSAGSVKKIKLGNTVITGDDFRGTLDLKSSNFKITFNSKDIQVDCLGYGHDVGMSQWGAGVMASTGKNYEQILIHYYQGVKIVKIDSLK